MSHRLDVDQAIVEKDGDQFKATPYFEDFLSDIITALGGEGVVLLDAFSETVNTSVQREQSDQVKKRISEIEESVDSHLLEAKIKQIEIDTIGFYAKVKSVNYTSVDKDWVEARNGVTIKLPDDPLVNHQVIVSNGDGSMIKIDGNGNDIKFTKTGKSITTRNQGTSLHFQLFEDEATKYWRIR